MNKYRVSRWHQAYGYSFRCPYCLKPVKVVCLVGEEDSGEFPDKCPWCTKKITVLVNIEIEFHAEVP